MPLVGNTDAEQLGPVAQIQEPDALPPASVMGTLGAATRLSNVAGAFFDRINHPAPEGKAVPGFDPLASIPPGYEQYASRFLDAHSPLEVDWIKGRINDEIEDRKTIARAGGWGTAASMFSGATDPLTIASMAIPFAGETRLAQLGRMALISGGTTAAQEGLMHELSQTRTASESALNIAGSTVLGGILGAAIRPHVPVKVAETVGEDLSRELHTENGGTKVMGPEQRSVLDTALPSDLPESFFAGREGEVEHVEYGSGEPEEAAPGYTVEEGGFHEGTKSEEQTAARTAAGGTPTEGWRDSTSIRSEGAAEPLTVYRGGGREVGPGHFEEEALGAKTGHPSSGLGVFFTTSAEEAHTWGEVRPAHLDIRNPKIIPIEDLPAFDSAAEARAFSKDLEAKGYDGIELRSQHLGGHDWVVAFHPEQVIHDAEAVRTPHITDPAAEPVTSPEYINPGSESTTGAAAVARPGLEANTIARGGKTIAEGWIGQVAPGLRLLTSPSNEVRELVQQLAETREILNKNLRGIATPMPVETALRRQEGVWYQGWKARGDAFRAYRERMAGLDQPAISRREFGQEVAYAMRRGDKSAIPEAADAAAKTRAIVFEPLKARALKLGLLPEDVKAEGADSYLTRQYDARKIKENLGHWIDLLAAGFRAQGVDAPEARDIAHKATRNVLGSERGTMDWRVMDDIVPQSGRMKERTLKLPDQLLEPYLNSDIDHLSHSYLRSMAPEVEMTERFGSRDMKDSLDSIRDEYTRMMERAKARGDNDAVTALDARRDADIRDLSAVRDRLYGTFGQPKDPAAWFVRAGRFARSFNALRLLGAATLAHVPDIANVITRYGLPNTFAAMGKLATSLDAIKVTQAEARRLGVGLDMVMNSTASLLGDYASHSQFAEQRFMSRATRGFTIATGETPLISTIQSLASAVGQDELLRNAEKLAAGKLLPQRTLTKLASAGIDKPMLQRIAAQAAEHGQQINGLKFGMSDKWTDAAAAQAYEAAILREAHGMTLSPSAGDTPLLMSSELGKLILQFKSFAFAATRHVALPLAQGVAGGDPRAITGLFSLAMAGFLSYAAKQKAAGQPIETENLGRLAMEVADKSNLAGWTGEAVYPAIWQLGFKDYSRWSDRDATETLLGPSAGTLGSIYERRLPSKVFGNQEEKGQTFTRSDLHFLRRLSPGQNLWYFRHAVNALEDRVGDAFDLPGTSNADRAAQAANQ